MVSLVGKREGVWKPDTYIFVFNELLLVDAINTFIVKGSGIDKRLHTLLESYPQKKVLVTNAYQLQMKEFGLDKMPYEAFTMEHNPNKQDPLYFQSVMKNYGLFPEDIVYFDHNIEAITSASSLDISSYHFNHVERDLGALKELLDRELLSVVKP